MTTSKHIDSLNKAIILALTITGYGFAFVTMPYLLCGILGFDAFGLKWGLAVMDPLIPFLFILAGLTAVLASLYGYGYYCKGYPGLLEHAAKLEKDKSLPKCRLK